MRLFDPTATKKGLFQVEVILWTLFPPVELTADPSKLLFWIKLSSLIESTLIVGDRQMKAPFILFTASFSLTLKSWPRKQ